MELLKLFKVELIFFLDSILCDLFPGNRVPRFFRVSKQDESSFPPSTFENLGLEEVSVVSDASISVKWHLELGFYYSDYDWGLIFRRIGDLDNPNMFYKTRLAYFFVTFQILKDFKNKINTIVFLIK